MNADNLRNLLPSILTRRARSAATFTPIKEGDEVLAGLAFGVRVDSGVVGHEQDMQFRFVGSHDAQCLRGLLRRPEPTQHMRHERPKRPIGISLGRRSCPRMACFASGPRSLRLGGSVTRFACQFTTEGSRTALQNRTDLLQAHPQRSYRRQCHAVISLHLLESSRYRRTLPEGQGVAF